MDVEVNIYPRWYQDFSLEQMKNLKLLQCIMNQDCEEMVTGRTQRALSSIGVTSTLFSLAAHTIKKLQESTNCNVIKFLREIYKILTGNYFEEESYRDFYNCNERIILSAIAFLSLPEAIVELHKRLPPIKMPKLYSKPKPPTLPIRTKMSSPYEEKLFVRPDWASYMNALQRWREQRELTPLPKIILPPKDCIISSFEKDQMSTYSEEYRNTKIKSNIFKVQAKNITGNIKQRPKQKDNKEEKGKDKQKQRQTQNIQAKADEKPDNIEIRLEEENYTNSEISTVQSVQKSDSQKFSTLNIPPLYENTLFDFTINGISEKPGPVEYKICGVLQPPQPNKKSWLHEKHAHYIIAGASDEPPACPVTYEMTGIANVTPSDSNEKFFSVLKLGDGPNKIYPSGRKNLSRHWQEWLQNVDEEFRKVEREANNMIKSIEAVTKLVFPRPACDSCCSCRQTRKSYLKSKETRAPYFVIDTIAEDDSKRKYIVGSMAMHSPAPTPPESTMNLLEVIASKDVITTNLIINGVTNEKGETQYFITGTKDEVLRIPTKVVERPPPRPPRNVPPCVCTIQQVFTEVINPSLSHDNIPWTKEDGLCFGKKFRPLERPAYSCKMYPGDKSCRRSPFKNEIIRIKHRTDKAREKELKGDTAAEKKKMYSIADFQPCGDEHGMSICGGPWGALHTLTPEELAEEERMRKEILRSPPCGTKPGRAVCEGPFGERIPLAQRPRFRGESVEIEELEDEEEEEEEEAEGKKVEPKPPVKEKEKRRDKSCHMHPETIAERRRAKDKKTTKFIPDPNYPGYDDPWNIFRIAPSAKESESDFKTLLKLSSPKPPTTPVASQSSIKRNVEPAEQDTPTSGLKRGVSKKKISSYGRSRSEQSAKGKKLVGQMGSRFKETEKRSTKLVKSNTSINKINKETKKGSTKLVKSDASVNKINKETKRGLTKSIKSNTSVNRTMDSKVLKRTKSRGGQGIDQKPVSTKRSTKEILRSKSTEPGFTNKTSVRPIGAMSENKFRKFPNVKTNKSQGEAKEKKKFNQKSNPPVYVKGRNTSTIGVRKKSTKSEKKKNTSALYKELFVTTQKNKIQELKNMMKSSNVYPYDLKPADIPEDAPAKCKLEFEDIDAEATTIKEGNETIAQLTCKDPCGWKTKSEQNLPTKKTLTYLVDPDYPQETVAVRPGGKPCRCRENRASKKILLYTIGGLTRDKKEEETKKMFTKVKPEDKPMRVLEGLSYYTPPPSPRRSDEYVPEYDFYDSPYDMCVTQRKDENLKYIGRYSTTGRSEGPTNAESCGCNQYIDTYGVMTTTDNEEKSEQKKEVDKARERSIDEKPPRERWKIALKDVALNDYFTRCRDSMPCWLKCRKFNKTGCIIPRRKLRTKKPVCECSYERKVLEHREDKVKWKERQKRLKSLKKQTYPNITDTSKPLVLNTKLMISAVKRIPRDDEYIDDIKYCITGVAEHYSHLPPKQVVDGIKMATPVHTPEPSKQEIPCTCLHRHWSPTNIQPGPIPSPAEIMHADRKRRQEAVIDAFRKIYEPDPVYHLHDNHGCEAKCSKDINTETDENATERDKLVAKKDNTSILHLRQPSGDKERTSKREIKGMISQGYTKGNAPQKKTRAGTSQIEIKGRTSQKPAEEIGDANQLLRDSTKLIGEKLDSYSEESQENYVSDTRDSLLTTAKIELDKMGREGFIFAKLPECFLMPQLQYWLMYRKGVALSNADKKKLLRHTVFMWNALDVKVAASKVELPPLDMTQAQLNKLTFDDAEEMKKKIAMQTAVYFSKVRQKRVLYGRRMWSTMEYGMFPSVPFKQAYFTYMAAKETDGLVIT